ncbi:MAG: DUF1570 domain-containing protein [Pirellula sp.]|jgi:hypothetical protein|nr:DUF1570 domain-containing protein [Pirellula sp.]
MFMTRCLLICLAVTLHAIMARGDFVIYSIPGSDAAFVLEGKAKILGLGVIEFTHPMGTIALSRDNTTVIKCPTRQEEFERLFLQAKRSGTIEDYLTAANQALRRGLLKEFRECCNAAYRIDSNHPTIQRLLEARRRIKAPIQDDDRPLNELKGFVDRSNMEVVTSPHYVMLHDTGSAKGGKGRQTRAEKRLELLEKVYESYFLKFALDGTLLPCPDERLKVVLFGDERDYLRFSTQLDASLASALGYWSPGNNTAVFFDQGTTQRMRALQNLSAELQRQKQKTRGTPASKETAHLANTLELLVKIIREEDDIEVVSHEATHQLAGNTGLMPRNKIAMRWAHEGLASYFETSSDAGWGGIGAVNQGRLKGYRRVSSDPQRAPIELLVSDLLFDQAQDGRQRSDAYGQAWALTHFLMETRGETLVDYYQRISELSDSDQGIRRGDLIDHFRDSFGDLRALESQWHQYMVELKTDVDRMRDAMR